MKESPATNPVRLAPKATRLCYHRRPYGPDP